MEQTSKPYAVLAVAVPSAIVVYALVAGWDAFSVLLAAVLSFCVYPIICMSFCMWFHGSGYRFLNVGIDWSSMGESRSREAASRWGKWMTAGMVVLAWSLALIFLGKIFLGFAAMAASVVLMLLPFVGGAAKGAPLPKYPAASRIAIVAIVTIASMVPMVASLDSGFASTGSNVDVSMDDEGITVKAPFFDHRFLYEEIDDCQYFEDFDKGKRVMGFGSLTISSGHFRNSLFGDYELASYNKVAPCIAISVGGEMYAFNQASVAETLALYEELVLRLPRRQPDLCETSDR